MKKKWITLALALTLAFSFAFTACEKQDDKKGNGVNSARPSDDEDGEWTDNY